MSLNIGIHVTVGPTGGSNIHLTYDLEGNSFVFPRVLILPRGSGAKRDLRENKTN